MILANWYLSNCQTPLNAYNTMQCALMERFVRRGGTVDEWISRLAPAFRRRYGWMCGAAK